jgi:predicted ferric reductase
MGFLEYKNPPTICTNGWMMNAILAIAYSAPKESIESVASGTEIRKPHQGSVKSVSEINTSVMRTLISNVGTYYKLGASAYLSILL